MVDRSIEELRAIIQELRDKGWVIDSTFTHGNEPSKVSVKGCVQSPDDSVFLEANCEYDYDPNMNKDLFDELFYAAVLRAIKDKGIII